jgi:hypothetical protein
MTAHPDQSTAIALSYFQGQDRPRWGARLELPASGDPEGYGATPDEALRNLADALSTADIERLRVLHSHGSEDR